LPFSGFSAWSEAKVDPEEIPQEQSGMKEGALLDATTEKIFGSHVSASLAAVAESQTR